MQHKKYKKKVSIQMNTMPVILEKVRISGRQTLRPPINLFLKFILVV